MTNENVATDVNENIGLPVVESGGYLGTKFNGSVTTEQALKLSGLDYKVRYEPSDLIPSYNNYYVERENGQRDYFHSTQNSYRIVQNSDTAKFIDDASFDFPDSEWYSMGSVHQTNNVGTTTFMQKRVKGFDLILDPNGSNDITECYIIGRSSHNGRYAQMIGMLWNRLFCANQLPSLQNQGNLITRKHTDRVFSNMEDSINVFKLAQGNLQSMSNVANKLYSIKANYGDTQKIFDVVNPVPELKFDKGIETPRSKGSITQWENKRDLLHDIWTGKTNRGGTMKNLEDNGWKVLQTLIELSDKFGGKGDINSKLTSELFNSDRQVKRQNWLQGTLDHFELSPNDYVVV